MDDKGVLKSSRGFNNNSCILTGMADGMSSRTHCNEVDDALDFQVVYSSIRRGFRDLSPPFFKSKTNEHKAFKNILLLC